MATTRVAKWGNSLAVRIPKAIAEEVNLREGDPVTVTVPIDGGLVIKPSRRKYQLRQLASRITTKNRHEETDWGQPQGGRVVVRRGWVPRQVSWCGLRLIRRPAASGED